MTTLKSFLPLCLAAILCGFGMVSETAAQNVSIEGRVVDADTDEPLPGVNVFLDQTTHGRSTNGNGAFEIRGVSPGSYRLVASMMGYATVTRPIEVVPEERNYRVDFRLQPTVLELNAIEIETERPREWERNLQRFQRQFLGTSPNAGRTEILNPYVLEFTWEDGVFRASASAPLEIVNRALGYRLVVALTYYSEATRMLLMGGPILFEELEPADALEAAQWKERREEAYRGSLMHLLRVIIEGTARREGFFVAHDIVLGGRRERVELGPFPILKATERSYLYRLSFDHSLYVEYGRNQSRLRMAEEEALLHEAGYLYTSEYERPPMIVSGAMSNRRVADLVPRDYGL